jgi:hypothetical protein
MQRNNVWCGIFLSEIKGGGIERRVLRFTGVLYNKNGGVEKKGASM